MATHNGLLAFVQRVAAQRPEKPDYWTPCGQCGDNINTAQELLETPLTPADVGETIDALKAEQKNLYDALKAQKPDADYESDDEWEAVKALRNQALQEYEKRNPLP